MRCVHKSAILHRNTPSQLHGNCRRDNFNGSTADDLTMENNAERKPFDHRTVFFTKIFNELIGEFSAKTSSKMCSSLQTMILSSLCVGSRQIKQGYRGLLSTRLRADYPRLLMSGKWRYFFGTQLTFTAACESAAYARARARAHHPVER